VFYELALRHLAGLPTVHLIRKGDKIPFDNKDFRTIEVNTTDKYDLVQNLDVYRSQIATYSRSAIAQGAEASNPIRLYAPYATVVIKQ
jgi:hypothetical protein